MSMTMQNTKPQIGAFFVFRAMRELEQQNNISQEVYLPDIDLGYESRGSVYAAVQIDTDRYVTGGSIWDRRHSPFNEQTRNAPGLLCEVVRSGSEIRESVQIMFPSMVNAIVPIRENVFIGCKRGQGSFNILNNQFELLRSSSDEQGDGIYNAVLSKTTENLFVVTRNGYISQIDAETLAIERYTQLTDGKSRLWSIATRNQDGSLFVGDYSGSLYSIDSDLKLNHTIRLTDYIYDTLIPERRKYDPSVFGITVTSSGQVVTAIRWGQIDWFDIDNTGFNHSKSVIVPEEISQIISIGAHDDLLVGTRSGKVLHVRVSSDQYQIRELVHIPPAFQSDNTVWSIEKTKMQSVLVSFADGQILEFKTNGLIGDQ